MHIRPEAIAEGIGRTITRLLTLGMILSAACLAILMVAQIILRYVLEVPFLGIEETSVLFGLWLYFLSAAYVTKEGRHITGGFLSVVLHEPRQVLPVQLFNSLLCVGVSVLCSFYSITYLFTLADSGRKSAYLGWPTTIWVASVVVGFAFMAIYFLLEAWGLWRLLRGSSKLSEGAEL